MYDNKHAFSMDNFAVRIEQHRVRYFTNNIHKWFIYSVLSWFIFPGNREKIKKVTICDVLTDTGCLMLKRWNTVVCM